MYFKTRRIASMTAAILIGITFLISGSGKLFGDNETPAQMMAFIKPMINQFHQLEF